MHVRNLGYPFRYKSGAPKPPFSTISQLNGKFNSLYLRNETRIGLRKWSRALQTTRVAYIVSKPHELWSTNSFKLEVSFHPPSVNSVFCFIARARFRRRRSANRTQPNFAERWTVNGANNLQYRNVEVVPPEKNWGPKIFSICSVFRRRRDLMANICRMKRDRQSGKGFGKYEGSPTLSQNFLNVGPQTG